MDEKRVREIARKGNTLNISEERVREIVREEIIMWYKDHAIRTPLLGNYDDIDKVNQ